LLFVIWDLVVVGAGAGIVGGKFGEMLLVLVLVLGLVLM